MARKLEGNVVKCPHCASILEYDESEIITRECTYTVQTYAGETYLGKFIICPQCKREIEIYN